MLSALLQSFVEDVLEAEARHAFPRLNTDPNWKLYWRQVQRWGNPSNDNIVNLLLRLGIPDVFDGLSWQRITTVRMKQNLVLLNEVRNDVAHGDEQLKFNGQPYSLTLAEVKRFRDFAENFGARFEAHVQSLR